MSRIEENADERQRREAGSLTEEKVRAAMDQMMSLPSGFGVPACRCCGAPGSLVRPLSLRGAPSTKIVLCEGCDVRRTIDASWPAGAPCGGCGTPLERDRITVPRSGEWLCAGCAVRGDPRGLKAEEVARSWEQLAAEKTRFVELELERLTKLELERRMKEATPVVATIAPVTAEEIDRVKYNVAMRKAVFRGEADGDGGLTAGEVKAVMRKAVFRGETDERSPPAPLPAGPAPRRMRLGEEEPE